MFPCPSNQASTANTFHSNEKQFRPGTVSALKALESTPKDNENVPITPTGPPPPASGAFQSLPGTPIRIAPFSCSSITQAMIDSPASSLEPGPSCSAAEEGRSPTTIEVRNQKRPLSPRASLDRVAYFLAIDVLSTINLFAISRTM